MPKKVTPKESAVAVRAVSKNSPTGTQSSKSVKKKASKVSRKKTAKKSVAKKVSAPSKAPKIEQKLERLEKLHATKTSKTVKVPASKKASVQKDKLKKIQLLPSTQRTLSLLALSPYRFPIDTQKLAIATARYSGVLFVVLGAIFTLLYADSSLSSKAFLASTLSPLTETQLITTEGGIIGGTMETLDCKKPENYLNTQCANSVDTTPLVDIIVNNPEELTGSVQVKIKVPFAEYVTLMAFNKTLGTNVSIGTAKKVGTDAWEYYWNTTQFEDGTYKLKAVIRNGYGVYEEVDDTYVTVVNTVPSEEENNSGSEETEESDSSEATTTTSITTTTTAITQALTSNLVVKNDTNSYEYNIEVRTEGAEKVKIYVRKESTTSRELLGYAYKSSSNLWKYRWLLSGVTPGSYTLTAASLQSGREYLSNGVTVIVPETKTETTLLKTATTTQTVVVDEEAETEEEDQEKNLTPEISVSVDGSQPISGVRTIKISVDDAKTVELYTRPAGSLVQKYLGVATAVDDDVWVYRFDSRRVPNGGYSIFAYATNAYGTYAKELTGQKVFNEILTTYTEEQQKTITQLQTITEPITKEAPVAPLQTATTGTTSDEVVVVADPLASFKEAIDEDLQRLAAALRTGDESAINRAYTRLDELSLQMRSSGITTEGGEDVGSYVDSHITEAISRTKENVERIEKVIIERTGESAVLDSDNDDISDYDEVHIYSTDPFSADTDGDGFTDGAEILSGFDPLDPRAESTIAYESPKETGVVREDILSVISIAAVEKDDEVTNIPAPAIITGKALPNSFVTLYVFSTPVVVTVKTDAEGNWTYRFDKELEDGEHQVYVGVTDNAGKLVAKSNPFTFVKEAEAYTPTSQVAPQVSTDIPQTSIASRNMLYLVLSISVVAIGLVLILLGLYLERRQMMRPLQEEPTTV